MGNEGIVRNPWWQFNTNSVSILNSPPPHEFLQNHATVISKESYICQYSISVSNKTFAAEAVGRLESEKAAIHAEYEQVRKSGL